MSLYATGLITIGDAIESVTGEGSPAENTGSVFRNNVFEMRAYCWCDGDDCDMCVSCTCPDEAWRYFMNGQEVPAEVMYAGDWLTDGNVRRTERVPGLECPVCRGDVSAAPNFRHFGTGFEVWWYKYAGRGMHTNRELRSLEWLRVQTECVRSVGVTSRRVPSGVPLTPGTP